MDARVHLYTATALAKGRVASPMLGRLYPPVLILRRLSGPQDQYGHEGVKKIFHTSNTVPVHNKISPKLWKNRYVYANNLGVI